MGDENFARDRFSCIDGPAHGSDAHEWQRSLRRVVGTKAWSAWFTNARFHDSNANRTLIVPNLFVADWLGNNHGHWLRRLGIRVEIATGTASNPKENSTMNSKSRLLEHKITNISLTSQSFDPEMSLDKFIVSTSNRVAFEVVKRLDSDCANPPYTPLYINGIAGVGKTHLMQGIAQKITERGRNVLYFSSDQFLNKFVKAVRERSIEEFSDELLAADAILLDDFQFLIGKERTQEYFFKILNNVVGARKIMIISSDQLPYEFIDLHERMRSRLGSGMIATVEGPDYELRVALLRFWDQSIPDDVLHILAKLDISIRELKGALTRLSVHASCSGMAITVEFARSVLAELTQTRRLAPSSDDIMHEVLAFAQRNMLKISKDKLRVAGRTAVVSEMRQIFMFLAHEIGGMTPACIGRYLNNRDRTTIRHGILKIKNRMAEERRLVDIVNEIRGKLGA